MDASLVLAGRIVEGALDGRGEREGGCGGEREKAGGGDEEGKAGGGEKGGKVGGGEDSEKVGLKRKAQDDGWWDGEITGEREDEEDWIARVVRILDMALIMAGGAGREDIVETLLEALQSHLDNSSTTTTSLPPTVPTQSRKRRIANVNGDSHDDIEPEPEDDDDGYFPTHIPPHIPVPLTTSPIPVLPAPSMRSFEQHMRTARTPLVLTGAIQHWPAMGEQRAWRRRGYLMKRTMGGRRLVPVEIGKSYTAAGWGQRIVSFGGFVREFISPASVAAPAGGGGGAELNQGGDNKDGPKIGYLAQHDLFAQIPALRNDICIPDYCYTNPPAPPPPPPRESKIPKLDEPLLNAWFGPPGTVSPLHTDPYHNILCQVVGRKYVRLYDPAESGKLYPRGTEDGGVDMSNTSLVDVEGGDAECGERRFPLFGTARYVETVLGEGECLYIPVGWWHYVRSLTVSFSVSFWWN